jgi:hypothetical protein
MTVRTRLSAMAIVVAVGAGALAASSARADGAAPKLPPAVQAYVNGVNRNQLERLVTSFAPRATVIDVGRRIVGRAAIRTWAEDEVMGGSLRVIRVAENPWSRRGLTLLVRWSPAGSEGFLAYYRFVLENRRIAVADLQYA